MKQLRKGYTTGSCAAAAASAALQMLLGSEEVKEVSIVTPNQTRLDLQVENITRTAEYVECAVRKDAGDDPDVTNGILIFAKASKRTDGIVIDGGTGVGRVTRKGLQQNIGEAAINKVPRSMIEKEIERRCSEFHYDGGVEILISIPEGVELAKKTFNPRLGIVGGLSVLGTTGIVEPMSEKALTDTIFVEMKFLKENGKDYCYVIPGNYGKDFLTEELRFDIEDAVKCSNYVGETIEFAKELQMKGLLLIGHIGKFVKLAAGIMNTHSGQADGRMEILAAHAALCGADRDTVTRIMESITTKEALDILNGTGLLDTVMRSVMKKIEEHLAQKAGDELMIGAILFSEQYQVLGKTENTEYLIRQIKRDRG